jgi:hypothetical protein
VTDPRRKRSVVSLVLVAATSNLVAVSLQRTTDLSLNLAAVSRSKIDASLKRLVVSRHWMTEAMAMRSAVSRVARARILTRSAVSLVVAASSLKRAAVSLKKAPAAAAGMISLTQVTMARRACWKRISSDTVC